MAGDKIYGEIVSKLQAFVQSIDTSSANPPTGDEKQSIILYGQGKLGIPRDHHKLKGIAVVQDQTALFKICEVLLRGELHNEVLFKTTIHNSSLRSCILIECTIYGSFLDSCQLKDCRIQKKVLASNDTPLTKPFISWCHIENTALHDTEIFNSTIDGGLPIKMCKMEHTLVAYSLITLSTLRHCGIQQSNLYNCNVSGVILTKSVVEVKNGFALRELPCEIREMIYSRSMAIVGLGKNPVAALRPDPFLYREVLETYFKKNFFFLSAKNHESFKSAVKTMPPHICKLNVDGEDRFPMHDVSAYFPIGTKINEIQVELYGPQGYVFDDRDNHALYFIVKIWLNYFGTVSKLTVKWHGRDTRPLARPPLKVINGIIKVSRWLRIAAVRVGAQSETRSSCTPHIPGYEVLEDTDTWTWSAEKGGALSWAPYAKRPGRPPKWMT